MSTYRIRQAICELKTVLERAKRQVERFEANPIYAVGLFAEGSDDWNHDHLNDPRPVAQFLQIPVEQTQLAQPFVHANRNTIHEGPYFLYLRSSETSGNRSVAQELQTQCDALRQLVSPVLEYLDRLPSDAVSRFRHGANCNWFMTLFDLATHHSTPLLEATRERWLTITGPAPNPKGHATLLMNYPHELRVDELTMQLGSMTALFDEVIPGTIWSRLRDDMFSSTVRAIEMIIADLERATTEPSTATDGTEVRRRFAELHEHFSSLARFPSGFGVPEWQLVKLTNSFRMPAARTWCDFPLKIRHESLPLSQRHADAEYLLHQHIQDDILLLLEKAGNALPPNMFDGPVMFQQIQERCVVSSGAHLNPSPVAKWVRFVFNSLLENDRPGQDVRLNYLSAVGRALNPFNEIYGYAILKNGFFAASAKAIELAKLLPVGTSSTTTHPITASPTADGETRTERLLDGQAKQSNMNTPQTEEVSKADGFFGTDGFRYSGVEVHFGRAALRYRLVKSLWNESTSTPFSSRNVEDVINEVYGEDNETNDSTFRQLCSDTKGFFQRANCPLEISNIQGKVCLKPVCKML